MGGVECSGVVGVSSISPIKYEGVMRDLVSQSPGSIK